MRKFCFYQYFVPNGTFILLIPKASPSVIRGQKVMLDFDLASLYQVETKQLNRQVKRNIERFPDDFMFQLSDEEFDFLRCQFGTSKNHRGGHRYKPYAFTELGIKIEN